MSMSDQIDVQSWLQNNPDLAARNPGLATTAPAAAPRKYRNVPVEYNGRRYDSIKEAERAAYLDVLVRAGEIAAVIPQVTFRLAGGITYRCDFMVLHNDGTYRVEDVKGGPTAKRRDWRMIQKLFKERYGRPIMVI